MAKATKKKVIKKKLPKQVIDKEMISQFANTDAGSTTMLEPAPGQENIKADLKEKISADVTEKLSDNIAPSLADDIQPVVSDSVDQAVDEFYDDSKVQEVTETAKNILSSTTLWGITLSFVSKIASLLGYEFGDDTVTGDIVNQLVVYGPLLAGGIGDAIAFRGRLRARHQLVFKRIQK